MINEGRSSIVGMGVETLDSSNNNIASSFSLDSLLGEVLAPPESFGVAFLDILADVT